jgi:HxlR-like helix-turn-helix
VKVGSVLVDDVGPAPRIVADQLPLVTSAAVVPFIDHLHIPRAVLASRLKALIAAGVMTRVAGERHLEYELTDKGTALWPVILSLMSWGDDFCAPDGPRRLFRHAADGGQVDRSGRCDACGSPVPAADTIVTPGPGLERPADDDSWVTTALTRPHRLLEPLHAAEAAAVPLPARPARQLRCLAEHPVGYPAELAAELRVVGLWQGT